jgi:amino acid adenylation domain-containing protein
MSDVSSTLSCPPGPTLIGPELTVPESKGLHQWFEEQARKSPDELALVGEITLTYGELDCQSTALARRLVAMGVAADQLVVIFLPRSARTIVAIMAVLKSGAAYFPIDVAIPKARLAGLLEDARPVAIITEDELVRTLPMTPIPIVLLDEKAVEESPGPELPTIRGSQLAYVIPTSGTTGRPKLIGVEHRQTAHLLTFATQSLLQPGDVRCVPFIDSPSADSSVSQIFPTLALGGTLVLVPDILQISASPYYKKFTCLGTVHSLLTIILNVTGLPPSVQFIGLGAEAIPAELLNRLDGMPQVRKVVNYYGPTETTVYCTVAVLLDRSEPENKIDLSSRGRVIGRPIANTRVYLVDESDQPVPPDTVGEILIAGGLVARGYLNFNGKETANFLPDPFALESGERLYRSGDLARLRPDGQLEFHGRKDHQLKFNGVRIEAAEIENALLSFPGIRQALVDIRPDESGKKRLVGYVVADPGTVSRQKVKKVLGRVLPGAMIPQHVVVMESFPLTPIGKIDRRALAQLPLELEPAGEASDIATPTESKMKEIFEKNLSRENIGPDQDYFELGGDSLSALGLLAAIEKTFGLRLKPQRLLESSTIIELAREIDSAQAIPARPVEISSFLALHDSGKKTPLILLPGGSGERFLAYKNFALGFLPDHPVHVLQSPYAQMKDKVEEPVAQLAAVVARQIIGLVEDRPFVLFGHCVGGLLAWHVAAALQKEKTPPFKLVIYDTPVPQKGINIRPRPAGWVPKTRLQRFTSAYQLAWADWSIRHDDTWPSKARFGLWAIKNVFMRKGLDRSEAGKDNFAKLTYLRALQGAPLSSHTAGALLLYHRLQAESVSKSLWSSHSSGAIEFDFIPGDHDEWESAIFNAIPMVRGQLEALDAVAR